MTGTLTLPPTLLHAIYEAMRDPACIGGGLDVDYRPRRFSVRLYLRALYFIVDNRK